VEWEEALIILSRPKPSIGHTKNPLNHSGEGADQRKQDPQAHNIESCAIRRQRRHRVDAARGSKHQYLVKVDNRRKMNATELAGKIGHCLGQEWFRPSVKLRLIVWRQQ